MALPYLRGTLDLVATNDQISQHSVPENHRSARTTNGQYACGNTDDADRIDLDCNLFYKNIY